MFTSPSTTTATTGLTTTPAVKPDRPQARPLTGRKAASTPSIPEATTCKPLSESYEQTVSADNLSSQGTTEARSATTSMTEAGGRENLAAEAVAANVLSSVLGGAGNSLESPNDNETLSPLLEAEEKDLKERSSAAGNLNLKDNRNSSLDVVSLASTLASDLAHLVESMNLAERPGPPHPATNVNMNRNGRPITAR